MATKQIVVNVPEDLHAALNANRVATGVPVGEFVRRAIRMALHADQFPPKIEKRYTTPALPVPGGGTK